MTVSTDRPEPVSIWAHYQAAVNALTRFERDILSGAHRPREFQFLTAQEISDRFRAYRLELDLQATFFLLASFESCLQLDFRRRVDRRSSHKPLDKRFREIAPSKVNNPDQPKIEEIIAIWKDLRPPRLGPINTFNHHFACRHWLAHGRYFRNPDLLTCPGMPIRNAL